MYINPKTPTIFALEWIGYIELHKDLMLDDISAKVARVRRLHVGGNVVSPMVYRQPGNTVACNST